MARTLATSLAAEPPSIVVHSGLVRTERLARMIVARTGARLLCDGRWRERDFGSWEGRSWQAIWRETGNLMDRMMTHAAEFRPGGGETTAELFDRATAAWAELPRDRTVIVVAHGGPIAAARAQDAGRSIAQLVDFIPAPGTVSVTR
jgi:broad specificity phosphatase PhoE